MTHVFDIWMEWVETQATSEVSKLEGRADIVEDGESGRFVVVGVCASSEKGRSSGG